MLPLRPNVCILLYNKKHKLFLGERYAEDGVWQFPQGGVEKKDSLRKNVLREIGEELGLKKKLVKITKKCKATYKYNWKTPPRYAKRKWRGQSQTFWLVEFLGKDKDIDLEKTKHPEFMSWRWCSPKQVRRLAEKKRLPGYRKPLKEFEELARTLKKKRP